MEDLKNLVFGRLFFAMVFDIEYKASDLVGKFGHIYTEEQIQEEINRQTTKENK